MEKDNVIPFRPTPEHVTDSEFVSPWFDYAVELMHADARRLMNAETIFKDAKRRKMVFDRVPVGHDVGYRCYDGDKHDPESAFTSGEYGDGMSEDEAYVDWLRNVDSEPAPKVSRVIHSSRYEPNEYAEPRYEDPDDIDFDSGLTEEDRDER